MSHEISDAVGHANDDSEIGCIVFTGAGRGFCAGADIRDQFHARLDERDQGGESEWLDDGWISLARKSKPLVAAVNGVAVGVGVTMILPFDVIIASDRARFGMFFVKMALVPELASSYFLVQRVGFGQASEMCLTARMYEAEEAGRIGLVNRVVPHEKLLDEAMATAGLIAANPGPQLRWIKDLLMRNGSNADHREVMRLENAYLEKAIQSPEHREAVDAFLAKRAPNFSRT
jgi:2-(1,2-epoxy-1,2-dihydrophenyl)acetyl-CoA isomerase